MVNLAERSVQPKKYFQSTQVPALIKKTRFKWPFPFLRLDLEFWELKKLCCKTFIILSTWQSLMCCIGSAFPHQNASSNNLALWQDEEKREDTTVKEVEKEEQRKHA